MNLLLFGVKQHCNFYTYLLKSSGRITYKTKTQVIHIIVKT